MLADGRSSDFRFGPEPSAAKVSWPFSQSARQVRDDEFAGSVVRARPKAANPCRGERTFTDKAIRIIE